ncbi:GntR family transcriptional regulator [Brevibacterium aurantiacum]|uniref:GntR family transcriptional regulator n=1 Tax=Brevibacterium aurantiacum TaxID=273384 RepID=UPI000F64051C|nr:GntR family transcriptional regulator [Brevibacterium aurantiacum]AZL07347.1 GntR family transcriptional regulator [Brevibacterium aurantiacum]
MVRAPVASLREQALAIIRDAITAGELDEDRIYSAAGLAKQLGMSLSPVREAMMALVTEGTVEAVPNRGFRLVPVTQADLEEITHVRVLLAVPAVRQLCEQAAVSPETSAQIEQLRAQAAATVDAAETGNMTAFFTHDRRFHEALLEFGLGRRAAEISLRLRDQSRIFQPTGAVDAVILASAQELMALVDLIEKGRADEAAELVTRNLYFFKRTGQAET